MNEGDSGKFIGFDGALDPRGPVSVLIEVRQAPIRLAQAARGGPLERFRPGLALPRADADASAQALADVRAEILSLQPAQEPVVLQSARMLVATLMPEQLKRLADMPQVQAIRPNGKRVQRHS